MTQDHVVSDSADLSSARSCDRAFGSPRTELPLFRFGLRQLFIFFAAMSVLFAVLAAVQSTAAFALLLTIAVVAMHVLATALGSRLRARPHRLHDEFYPHRSPTSPIADHAERIARLGEIQSLPRSPWHSRGSTALPWIRRYIVLSALTSGGIGSMYIAMTIGYRVSLVGIVVGGLSSAVLGGWFAFLGGSFYGVFRHGFRDALATPPRELHPADRPITMPHKSVGG